jgi:hypothetical protein
MPDFVRDALNEKGRMEACRSHPLYQPNDYIGSLCVRGGKLESTRQKRLNQMLDERKGGRVYMNMKWKKTIHFSVDVSPKIY